MRDRPPARLDGELTIYTAQQTQRTLGDLLRAAAHDTAAPLRVDLSAVTDADSAGLQLLLAAHRQASAVGLELAFVDCSDSVRDAAALLGLTDWLDGTVPSDAAHR